ncbi:Uncharacterized protein PHPALM_172 [Phytophthora palmivora]|uniref:Uncharacterized protein n=1 Tax=Phytophthora palmivora TaxID=4796 RepID=A0A2P4YVN3_9STRA|nr:Uncharacterized protein PHPALM_172 [Phytophthora palmivora]
MTEEWFTIVCGDWSRKEISLFSGKRRLVTIKRLLGTNEARTRQASNHRVIASTVFKMAPGRRTAHPKRPCCKLFRSIIRATPGAKKKRVMTVKKGVKLATETVASNLDKDRTSAETSSFDSQLKKSVQ